MQILVAVLISRTTGAALSALIGSLAAWSVINWAWLRFEGGHPTMAALGTAMLIIALRFLLSSTEVRERNKWLTTMELLTITMLACYAAYFSKVLRWY